MTPLLWNIFIVWALCAVFCVEYSSVLHEREEKQRERKRDRGL